MAEHGGADTDRQTVDRAHERLGETDQLVDEPVEAVPSRREWPGLPLRHLEQVGAGTERGPGSGEDHDCHSVVAAGCHEGIGHRVVEGLVESVAGFRPVKGDHPDAVVVVDSDHGCLLTMGIHDASRSPTARGAHAGRARLWGMRHGIVEGEPGIFPWPMGWWGRLVRRMRSREGAEPGEAGHSPAPPTSGGDGGHPDDSATDPGRLTSEAGPGLAQPTADAGRSDEAPPPGQTPGETAHPSDPTPGQEDHPDR